jgi:hypothetical protein
VVKNNGIAKAIARSAGGAIGIDALSVLIRRHVVDPYVTEPITHGVAQYFERFQGTIPENYH